jgi:hypothetical protein
LTTGGVIGSGVMLLGSVGSATEVVEVPPPQAEINKAVKMLKAMACQHPTDERFAQRRR